MLVFTRRIGERIILPASQAAITVVGVNGNAVRLGISAPDDIAIERLERHARKQPQEDATSAEEAPLPVRLLVCDSDDSLQPLYLALAKNGWIEVRMASDAVRCIEQLREFRPHLLILDAERSTAPLADKLAELRQRRDPWRHHWSISRSRFDTVLNAMRERTDVPVTPVILLSSSREGSAGELGLPIIDQIEKPMTSGQLEEGIRALFAYRGWRTRLNQERATAKQPAAFLNPLVHVST